MTMKDIQDLLREITPALAEAIAETSNIPGWRGRAAHALLRAIDFLLMASIALLVEKFSPKADMGYVVEKIRHANQQLEIARQEFQPHMMPDKPETVLDSLKHQITIHMSMLPGQPRVWNELKGLRKDVEQIADNLDYL